MGEFILREEGFEIVSVTDGATAMVRLDDVDPDVFAEEDAWRRRLEEEYLSYHRWFREHNVRIPNPGWRAEYVEEIVALGYTTALGD
jgi:hypothetical protein